MSLRVPVGLARVACYGANKKLVFRAGPVSMHALQQPRTACPGGPAGWKEPWGYTVRCKRPEFRARQAATHSETWAKSLNPWSLGFPSEDGQHLS